MKKILAMALTGAMAVSAFSATAFAEGNPVDLNVTTTFAGEDGNAQNFKADLKK